MVLSTPSLHIAHVVALESVTSIILGNLGEQYEKPVELQSKYQKISPMDFAELLESDDELRKKYNVPVPKEYWKLDAVLPDTEFNKDVIHPEYEDMELQFI